MRSTPPTVADVVRDVVERAAPGELPYFDDILRIHDQGPQQAANPRTRDELGGFGGLELAAQLITTILFEIVGRLAADHVVDKHRAGGRKPLSFLRRKSTPRHAKSGARISLPVPAETVRALQDDLKARAAEQKIAPDILARADEELRAALSGPHATPSAGTGDLDG